MRDGSTSPAHIVHASSRGVVYQWLIWICLYSNQLTFLHIPKTGGTSIELQERHPGPRTLFKLLRYMEAPHRHQIPSRKRSDRPSEAEVYRPYNAFKTCHLPVDPRAGCNRRATCNNWAPLAFSQWHMPPALLAACGILPPFNPYANGRATYCIVREPIERFISQFLYASQQRTIWPRNCRKTLRPSGAQLGEPELLEQMLCFLEAISDEFLRNALQHNTTGKILSSQQALSPNDFVVHVMPQWRFVLDDFERPTCDIIFSTNDYKHAALPIGAQSKKADEKTEALANKALRGNVTALSRVMSLYHRDFSLWNSVRRHEAASAAHAPLAALAAALLRRHPQLAQLRPSCAANATCAAAACPSCCRIVDGVATFEAGQSCIACLLESPSCAALELRDNGTHKSSPLVPRQVMGPICSTPFCNTCSACCTNTSSRRAVFQPVHAKDCRACEIAKCGGVAVGGAAQQAAPSELPSELPPEPPPEVFWTPETAPACQAHCSSKQAVPEYETYHSKTPLPELLRSELLPWDP